mmetsp:Transcript_2457/g.8765  ORF Transcript_2457/g.8765 Transcript_2457/m.8765 type:complete len:281 (-) Transcript_2457:703-1545(-)
MSHESFRRGSTNFTIGILALGSASSSFMFLVSRTFASFLMTFSRFMVVSSMVRHMSRSPLLRQKSFALEPNMWISAFWLGKAAVTIACSLFTRSLFFCRSDSGGRSVLWTLRTASVTLSIASCVIGGHLASRRLERADWYVPVMFGSAGGYSMTSSSCFSRSFFPFFFFCPPLRFFFWPLPSCSSSSCRSELSVPPRPSAATCPARGWLPLRLFPSPSCIACVCSTSGLSCSSGVSLYRRDCPARTGVGPPGALPPPTGAIARWASSSVLARPYAGPGAD